MPIQWVQQRGLCCDEIKNKKPLSCRVQTLNKHTAIRHKIATSLIMIVYRESSSSQATFRNHSRHPTEPTQLYNNNREDELCNCFLKYSLFKIKAFLFQLELKHTPIVSGLTQNLIIMAECLIQTSWFINPWWHLWKQQCCVRLHAKHSRCGCCDVHQTVLPPQVSKRSACRLQCPHNRIGHLLKTVTVAIIVFSPSCFMSTGWNNWLLF